MPTIILRQARADDLNNILQLFRETIETVNAGDYSPEQIKAWKKGAEKKEKWIEKIAVQYFLVAEVNNNMTGFGSMSKEGYLDFLYVSKDHQGMGIATKLYKALEQFARENCFSKITSDVSITAKPFFEKQGFNMVHQQRVVIDGMELVNYEMEKFLLA